MPDLWRVGTKVKLNVYLGETPVCQCHDARLAKKIVDGMNAVVNDTGRSRQFYSDMRDLSSGKKVLVQFGGLGCLTDDCTHFNDDTCTSQDPLCRIGRTVEAEHA